jgi:hypothetical protein
MSVISHMVMLLSQIILTSSINIPTSRYRTRAIITRGLYLFYPIFHCGLYLRAVCTAERLVITGIFFLLVHSETFEPNTLEVGVLDSDDS